MVKFSLILAWNRSELLGRKICILANERAVVLVMLTLQKAGHSSCVFVVNDGKCATS